MGRKYIRIAIRSGAKSFENILAFIDTGSDLTIIGTRMAKRLKIKSHNIERKWTASDGDDRHSPITEVEIRAEDDDGYVRLDEVMIDDMPLDRESGEEAILGLDCLQKARKVLSFDD